MYGWPAFFISAGRLMSRLMVAAALSVGIGSCSVIYDEDNCPDNFVVDADWMYAPDARPDEMAYFFFSDAEKKAVWRFDFAGREGGEVSLPDGTFAAIALNDDNGYNVVSDPSVGYDEMTVTTLPAKLYVNDGSGPDNLDGEAVMRSPSQLWLSVGSTVCRPEDARLIVYPRAMMAKYTCEVVRIVNLNGVKRISGAITGMASELKLADESRCGAAVTVPFSVGRAGDDKVLGSLLTIGRCDNCNDSHKLWLFVWLTDGRYFTYSFDVTSQVVEASDPMDVHIKIEGLSLPESAAGGGAFDVSVDGWQETIIDING